MVVALKRINNKYSCRSSIGFTIVMCTSIPLFLILRSNARGGFLFIPTPPLIIQRAFVFEDEI